MPHETFYRILVETLPEQQVDALLQAVTNERHETGECPLCGEEDMPIDEQGHDLPDAVASEVVEFRERHDEQCPVTLIEAAKKERTRA